MSDSKGDDEFGKIMSGLGHNDDKKEEEEKNSPTDINKKSSPDIEDNYDEDFEEIDEDIEQDDPNDQSNIIGQSKNFDSHAITVS